MFIRGQVLHDRSSNNHSVCLSLWAAYWICLDSILAQMELLNDSRN